MIATIDSHRFAAGGPPPGSDPMFANVALLLHMDGANSGTVFVDSSGHAATVSVTSPAQTRSDVNAPLFGTYLYSGSSGGRVYVADAPYLSLGSADFCIEMFIYKPAAVEGTNPQLAGQSDVTAAPSAISWGFSFTDDRIYGAIYAGGITHPVWETPTKFPHAQWQHVAMERVGNTLYMLRNGGVVATKDVTGVTVNDVASSVAVMSLGDYATGRWGGGSIDEFRMTVGSNRYGGTTYTVPTAPFPNF